jgi:hypothetical protein
MMEFGKTQIPTQLQEGNIQASAGLMFDQYNQDQ